MKKFIPFCFALLLAACGAGTDDPSSPTVLRGSEAALRASSKVSVVTLGERRAYDINWSQGKLTGTAKSIGLSNFQFTDPEVRLPDISLSYNKDGLPGQLYRLYQAAFGRTPDVAGFGFWKDVLENQGLTVSRVASEFLNSAESKALYGDQSDDLVFVDRLYRNVLHRSADSQGASFWLNGLKSGVKRVDVLLGFTDSAENKAATAAAMAKGIAFAEPGVRYIPVSNATGPSHVPVGSVIEVDGSNSTDANGDVLRYSWTVTVKPSGSTAALTNPTAVKASVPLDKPGTYELTLWVSDATSKSYSPAKVVVVAHSIVADSGTYTCSSISAAQAQLLYSTGHTYLDRDKDGIACDAADLAYEKSPTVPRIADTGIYKCSAITHGLAVLLYMQGHTYLDRDHDGKPCEATDINLETPVYVPPTTTPSSPSSGMCWVNGYTRTNGTHVSGYWRRC
jgi:hypothetical protein